MSLTAARAASSTALFAEIGPANLAGDDDAVGGRQRLAGDADLIGIDARLDAFAEIEIDDFVGNSVANLVRMAFGNGFAGKLKVLAGHRAGLQLRFVDLQRNRSASTLGDFKRRMRGRRPKSAVF